MAFDAAAVCAGDVVGSAIEWPGSGNHDLEVRVGRIEHAGQACQDAAVALELHALDVAGEKADQARPRQPEHQVSAGHRSGMMNEHPVVEVEPVARMR